MVLEVVEVIDSGYRGGFKVQMLVEEDGEEGEVCGVVFFLGLFGGRNVYYYIELQQLVVEYLFYLGFEYLEWRLVRGLDFDGEYQVEQDDRYY